MKCLTPYVGILRGVLASQPIILYAAISPFLLITCPDVIPKELDNYLLYLLKFNSAQSANSSLSFLFLHGVPPGLRELEGERLGAPLGVLEREPEEEDRGNREEAEDPDLGVRKDEEDAREVREEEEDEPGRINFPPFPARRRMTRLYFRLAK